MFVRRSTQFAAMTFALSATTAARADIQLVAQGAFPAHASDKSGLTDALADGTPHNRLGSLGSAIAYTGVGNRYVMLSDRGPKDGAVPYQCRFHVVDIGFKPTGGLQLDLVDTRVLKDKVGRPFVGQASQLQSGATAHRLDPEGARVGPAGSVFVSDEYGPHILEFDQDGKLDRELKVPQRYVLKKPHAEPAKELAHNKHGRVPNKGMEGLAITPDGGKLVGIVQGPLIQDGGSHGTNLRILEVDLASGGTREFLYPLESEKTGVSEILAVNDHEFLVLERSGGAPEAPRSARIYKIDITRASDISKIDALPAKAIPKGIVPVTKMTFFDLLDPCHGLGGPDFPPKLEGLAFGPDLIDGRHLLLVSSDNDCGDAPTRVFAFAIDSRDLPGFQRQEFRRPGR